MQHSIARLPLSLYDSLSLFMPPSLSLCLPLSLYVSLFLFMSYSVFLFLFACLVHLLFSINQLLESVSFCLTQSNPYKRRLLYLHFI